MGFGPIIGANTKGLLNSDITFSLNELSQTSHILNITFLVDSFNVGDVLSFGIDIDQLDDRLSDIGGGLLGTHGVGITATIGGSCEAEASTAFENVNNNSSQAALQLCGSTLSTSSNVPTPSSYLLMLAGFFALARSRKKL